MYIWLALASAIGIALFLFFSSTADPLNNDFFNFYAGAMIGPRSLYDPHRFAQLAASMHATNVHAARFYYVRMPYYAFLTRPLAWFAFPVALTIWRCIQGLAIAGSVLLWPRSKSALALVTLLSVSVSLAIPIAQDAGFILLFSAAAVTLARRQRHLLAGLVFSLCLIKPHLIVFVVLVLMLRKEHRFLAGAALGAAAQILCSFAVAPWNWPLQWISTMANPQMHPYSYVMPGLRAIAQTTPGLILAIVILAALVLGVCRTAKSEPLERAIALALAAGVLGNFHSYAVDCILLLPAIAIALGSRDTSERLTAVFLASPFPVMALVFGYPLFLQIAVLLLVLLPAFWPSGLRSEPPSVSGVFPRFPLAPGSAFGHNTAQIPKTD
jgi:hypothetical protein